MCVCPCVQLHAVPSVAWASDREATIRSGMAIDMSGDALRVCRPWYDIAVQVDAGSVLFRKQLTEMLGSIFNPEWRPELPTCYFAPEPQRGRPVWGSDTRALSTLLLERCDRHKRKHYCEKPPSASAWQAAKKGEPESWPCKSWDEVCRRAASIDILSRMNTAPAPELPPGCSEAADGPAAGEPMDASTAPAAPIPMAGASSTARCGKSGHKEAAEPCSRPRTLELYCGRAGWSAHQTAIGNQAWFLDWDASHVSRSFETKPEYDEGGQVRVLNGLSRSHFLHLDFLDFAMAVLGDHINVGDLNAIHDGLDCTTFTDMALSSSQRAQSNHYFGTSNKAFETNLRYHYLVAFHLFLQKVKATDLCMRSAENPKATREFHPLTTNLLEKPKADGGLGMAKFTFSFCAVTTARHQAFEKPTAFWSDHKDTLELFLNQDGSLKRVCCAQTPCNHFGSHARIRPDKDHKGLADRGSIYPDQLCALLASASFGLMGAVRTVPLDPAFSAEGSRDKCTWCGNRQPGGGKTYLCSGCPDVWHRRCIPNGFSKPAACPCRGPECICPASTWYCPNEACQTKAQRAAATAQ